MSRPVPSSRDAALEIAKEMRDERERFFALAASIRTFLEPAPGADPPCPIAYRLTEVLEEMLGDIAQVGRLVNYLSS